MISAHINDNNKHQSVKEHLENTSKYAAENGTSVGLENTMRLAGILHDIGKNTRAFDDYINASHSGDTKVRRGDINHSSAGAKYLMDLQTDKTIISELTKELIACAVFSHHGLNDCLTYIGEDKFTQRICPEKDIFYDEAIENSRDVFSENDISELFTASESEIKIIFEKILKLSKNIAGDRKGTEEKCFLHFCLERLILSMLIDADRRDTAEFMSGSKLPRFSDEERRSFFERCLSLLENELNSLKPRNKIDELRREMSEQCEEFALKNGDGIYKLSIPTGGGKTYASMRYALNLAIRTGKQHIIYIAPYLSILEQNAAEIKRVFDDDEHILEHHSNVFFDGEDTEGLKKYEVLADDWSSPIILTTMVRFLNVLFGGDTSDIRRIHRLKSSVIIIDEAQSIPLVYINSFNTMMNFLNAVCGTTVVMCTATQPLFEETARPLLYSRNSDIIFDTEKYSGEFKRADILTEYAASYVDTEGLSGIVSNVTKNNCLIILNTKSAVQALYDGLKNRISSDFEIVQLTTFMCAQHRLDTIRDLKQKLKDKQKIICVRTQLIEAGVDISFETVVRSLSGLDSIDQAAGRCNRNGESSERGKTYIVRYSEENISSLGDIRKAQKAVQTILYKPHGDLLMPESMDMYYKQYFFDRRNEMDFSLPKLDSQLTMYSLLADNEIGCREYKKKSRQKYGYLLSQAFKTAASHFKPIDDSGSIGIIVYYGGSERLIERLRETDDLNELRSILRRLQRYTVNIRSSSSVFRKLSDINAFEASMFDGSLYILSESYYDKGSGIKPELSELIY